MDQDQAKLILASFRPNGSDFQDPAFAEALALAAEDRDLGQWLAQERARDMAFADSLAEFPIPENLRENLFAALANVQDPPGYDEFDHEFAQVLGNLAPPSNLRSDILAAMEVEQKVTALPAAAPLSELPHKKNTWFTWPSFGLAAAAGIVAALVWTGGLAPDQTTTPAAQLASITPDNVQAQAINFLSGQEFRLDHRAPEKEANYRFLTSKQLPAPNILPAGLENASPLGCKIVNFNGKPASLICYQQAPDQPVVHLIVLRREAVKGDLPELANARFACRQCTRTGWSMAQWRDDDKAFFLLGKMDVDQLATVF
ncbi:hypothetical protein [Roseibacillus ishigakijimensis]|uniref:Uncharacterized protein n=1 Tax=Roseibacillus ishigakijimensis TaxID=454146 RepID=A0A934RQD5_9BACT|nr:hypothetical protein [Roseibacillus ishigakijimensis]MBK1833169.1 hypothetical protein [Roseibacillus ishigakijimensis]